MRPICHHLRTQYAPVHLQPAAQYCTVSIINSNFIFITQYGFRYIELSYGKLYIFVLQWVWIYWDWKITIYLPGNKLKWAFDTNNNNLYQNTLTVSWKRQGTVKLSLRNKLTRQVGSYELINSSLLQWLIIIGLLNSIIYSDYTLNDL